MIKELKNKQTNKKQQQQQQNKLCLHNHWICSAIATANQCPASPKKWQPSQPTPSTTIVPQDAIWYETSFWSACVNRTVSWSCLLPALCVPLCPPLQQDSMRSWRTTMSLALYSTAQQQFKHRCVVHVVFLLTPKYSIIPDTMKGKSTPSQLKPEQLSQKTLK